MSNRFHRRLWIASALGAGVPLLSPLLNGGEPDAGEPFPKSAAEAKQQLLAGNARFATGQTRHAHESANWRKQFLSGQRPFATILGCSDSRVPPELVFDQGFGDLFVVRVAGNVISPDVVGSMAYAARHLQTKLFVVLGHSGCGAVSATLDHMLKGSEDSEAISELVKLIEPGLEKLDRKLAPPALLDSAVAANVRWSVKQLSRLPAAQKAMAEGRLVLAGAVYELTTGIVRFLDG